jgi:hypothetical protein
MNNCAVRTALSGVMGSGLGVLFGVFMGTMDSSVRRPAPPRPAPPRPAPPRPAPPRPARPHAQRLTRRPLRCRPSTAR